MVAKTDAAWAAGFFEGEGSFGVHVSRRGTYEHRYPKLTVVQVDREPLERLRRIFGGSITRRRRATGRWKEQHAWIAVAGPAVRAAHEMWPWLSERRREQFRTAVSTTSWADKIAYEEWAQTQEVAA